MDIEFLTNKRDLDNQKLMKNIQSKSLYQQRLDKVLTKFKVGVSGIKIYKINKYLEITYFNDKLHLSNPCDNEVISIDTVQILKDVKELGWLDE